MFTLDEENQTAGMSDDEILREWIRLDKQVKELASQRSGYAGVIAQRASQERGGLKTVHLETADQKQKVKVEFRTEWKVADASQMEVIRDLLGETRFNEIFKVEYSPRSRALQSFLSTGSGDERFRTAKKIIQGIVIEEDKSPYVSVERS